MDIIHYGRGHSTKGGRRYPVYYGEHLSENMFDAPKWQPVLVTLNQKTLSWPRQLLTRPLACHMTEEALVKRHWDNYTFKESVAYSADLNLSAKLSCANFNGVTDRYTTTFDQISRILQPP